VRQSSLAIPIARLFREVTDDWNGDWRRAARWALVGPFRLQTVYNIAYLTFGIPLGIVYLIAFAFLLVGGLALSVVLIGIPLLILGLVLARRFNGFERQLAWRWVGVAIPAPLSGQGMRLLPRIGRFVRDPVTWTNLLFLVLRLPLGVGAGFLIDFILQGIWFRLLHPVAVLVDPRFGEPSPLENASRFLFGLMLIVPALHIFNGLAFLYGRFARLTLGPSDSVLQVETSQAEAARARISAEKAEQSRRELMVNVSHELRTPVASIRGHVESLLISAERAEERDGDGASVDAAQFSNYLTIIHRETERLGALVDDLLALARSEAGELSLVLRPIQVADVVREVHETLAPLAWRDRSVTVIADIPDGLPLALADRDRLAQVLLNLVRNAITYTPAGGIVSMSVEHAGPGADGQPGVAIVVADTGAGIAAEDLERIFDRFYRVDASRNRSSGGFGLGLSIVHDLVTAMGGTITAESQLGEGSRFVVRLAGANPILAKPDRLTPRVPVATHTGERTR
jgi:signal transduction histidine kinase